MSTFSRDASGKYRLSDSNVDGAHNFESPINYECMDLSLKVPGPIATDVSNSMRYRHQTNAHIFLITPGKLCGLKKYTVLEDINENMTSYDKI